MKKSSLPTGKQQSPLGDLENELGLNSFLDPTGISHELLWMCMVSLLRKGASLQLGVNKAGTSIILTIFDSDYPFKQFIDDIGRVNYVLAQVVAAYNKGSLPPEWFDTVEMYRNPHRK